MEERRWRAVRLKAVPNGRLIRDVAAQRLIESSEEGLESGALRRQVDQLELEEFDPETFWKWGEAQGYDVSITWGPPEAPETIEVQLVDRARAHEVPWAVLETPKAHKAWSEYANDPLESSFKQDLIRSCESI